MWYSTPVIHCRIFYYCYRNYKKMSQTLLLQLRNMSFLSAVCYSFIYNATFNINLNFWMALNFFQGLFILYSVYMVNYINFLMLNQSCIPGINSAWLWCTSLYIYSWIQLADILLRIFASIFIKNIGLCFSFLVLSLSSFWIRGDFGLMKWVGTFFLLPLLWTRNVSTSSLYKKIA